jgi:hypothetical protein
MMMLPLDDFDPNTLDLDWPSYVTSTNSDHQALVDYEDWLFVCNWLWRFKPSKHQTIGSQKGYLCRSAWIYPVGGAKFNTSLYLHVEIMKRVEPPPTIFHTQVDHKNRNRMDCRRDNLAWATPSQNNQNKALPPRLGGKWVKGTAE